MGMMSITGIAASGRAAEETSALPARIKLPVPQMTGGPALLDALAQRKSGRAFADVELPLDDLSTLLWVTAGINRDDGHFTYPTHSNRQDMILFVVMRSGAYRYDPKANALEPVAGGDQRSRTGDAAFVKQAAVNLIFVQDVKRWTEERRHLASTYGPMHAGLMMQSAGLYAAARDWSCVVRAGFDAGEVANLLQLPESQKVVITQSIGPRP
jgi:nitroreductase